MREPEPRPQNAKPADLARPGDETALRARLDALKADLGETFARDKAEKTGKSGSDGTASALGAGMRAASELVAGTLVGCGLGYGLDQYFGTKPVFLLLLLVVGMGAGFRNIYRLGMRPTVFKPKAPEPESSTRSDSPSGS